MLHKKYSKHQGIKTYCISGWWCWNLNPSIWKAEADWSLWAPGQPGLPKENRVSKPQNESWKDNWEGWEHWLRLRRTRVSSPASTRKLVWIEQLFQPIQTPGTHDKHIYRPTPIHIRKKWIYFFFQNKIPKEKPMYVWVIMFMFYALSYTDIRADRNQHLNLML